MRILWHSGSPWSPTGYGQQTKTFVPRIAAAGHDMAMSAWWGLSGSALEWEGFNVYPTDQKWGNTVLPAYAKDHKADLVICLMDAWVLAPQMVKQLPRTAVWCPVDHAPCPPRVADFFKTTGATPIAMSRFGERALINEGLEPLYVPHGIDTTVYQPFDHQAMKKSSGHEDNFIVGIVANNSGGNQVGYPRKAFPQMFMAFSEFYRRHPNARLYLHCDLTGRPGIEHGLDLAKLLARMEVPDEAITVTSQAKMEIGIAAQEMAGLYSSFDVLLNTSYGEGFGLPIIEAQACGTPVIVTDWTAMPELVGAGWKVGGDIVYDWTIHDSFYMAPNVDQIVHALEAAYLQEDGLRQQAREFALNYDADNVMQEHWLPALEQLAKPREIKPLPGLNREMRRRNAKAGRA